MTALAALVNSLTPAPAASGLGSALQARMRDSDGTVYYVDNVTGNNADSGLTEALAWATIAHAVTNASANGIVKVKNTGTDYAGATITRNMGSAANLLTIEALDSESKPTISGKIQCNTADYMRFRNLIADGTGVAIGGSLFGADTSDHIEWYGCEARNAPHDPAHADTGAQGFQPDTCSFLWWINCVASNGGGDTRDHGWYIEGGTDLYLWNCISYGNSGYGFHIYSTVDNFERIYFYNCTSDDNAKNDGTSTTGRSGVLVQGDHADGDFDAPTDIHFYNCMFTNHTEGGTNYGWRWRHARNQAPATIAAWPGGYPKSSMNNCLSFNNASGDLLYSADAGATEASVLENNGFITGNDPDYVDQAARDYHLLSGSPARSAGLADYTPPFDFDGNTRTAADIGAYKF